MTKIIRTFVGLCLHFSLILFGAIIFPVLAILLYIAAITFGGDLAGVVDSCSLLFLKYMKYIEDLMGYTFKLGKWSNDRD